MADLPQGAKLTLADVPQLLTILETSGKLTAAQKKDAITHMNDRGIFAGQAAIEITENTPKPVTKKDVDTALTFQTMQKIQAAGRDIELVRDNGFQKLQRPNWLKPSWGNNGVNPAVENASAVDGASAAANIAANIALLVNDKPELYSTSQAREAVAAAKGLAEKMLGTASKPANAADMKQLQQTMMDGLRDTVKQSGVTLTDQNGKAIDIEAYIIERSKEVESGAAQAVKAAKARGQASVDVTKPSTPNLGNDHQRSV